MLFNLYREFLSNYDFQLMPDVLLVFLVETCGKKISAEDLNSKREKIVDFIKSQKKTIDTDQQINWSQVATFVNSEKIKWTKVNLIKALNHINKFDCSKDFSSSTFGPITEQNYENIDLPMVYALCVEKNIKIDKTDTFDTMVNKYKSVFCSKQELYENIITKLGNCSKEALLNISKHLDHIDVGI